MKLREAIYVIVATVMWCVALPCWTSVEITREREETSRLKVRQRGAVIDAQEHLSSAIDRSTDALRQALDR